MNLYERMYTVKENQLTKALLHLLDAGGLDMVSYLCEQLEIMDRREFLSIESQPRFRTEKEEMAQRDSYPDGMISVQAVRIVIESKIKKNSVNIKQLEAHLGHLFSGNSNYKPEIEILLYITPDDKKPEILIEHEILWRSWNQVADIMKEYCQSHPTLNYLFRSFVAIKESAVDDKKDIPPSEKVAIVGGGYGEGKAEASGIYHCQKGRKFRDASYLAFYTNKRIAKIYKILKGPYPHESGGDCYDLELVKDRSANPIINDKRDKNNDLTPFTMGHARYACIQDLLDEDVRTTLALEQRMKEYRTNK